MLVVASIVVLNTSEFIASVFQERDLNHLETEVHSWCSCVLASITNGTEVHMQMHATLNVQLRVGHVVDFLKIQEACSQKEDKNKEEKKGYPGKYDRATGQGQSFFLSISGNKGWSAPIKKLGSRQTSTC